VNPTGPTVEVAVRSHRRMWTVMAVLVFLPLCPST
jgi:hypothetical protein